MWGARRRAKRRAAAVCISAAARRVRLHPLTGSREPVAATRLGAGPARTGRSDLAAVRWRRRGCEFRNPRSGRAERQPSDRCALRAAAQAGPQPNRVADAVRDRPQALRQKLGSCCRSRGRPRRKPQPPTGRKSCDAPGSTPQGAVLILNARARGSSAWSRKPCRNSDFAAKPRRAALNHQAAACAGELVQKTRNPRSRAKVTSSCSLRTCVPTTYCPRNSLPSMTRW